MPLHRTVVLFLGRNEPSGPEQCSTILYRWSCFDAAFHGWLALEIGFEKTKGTNVCPNEKCVEIVWIVWIRKKLTVWCGVSKCFVTLKRSESVRFDASSVRNSCTKVSDRSSDIRLVFALFLVRSSERTIVWTSVSHRKWGSASGSCVLRYGRVHDSKVRIILQVGRKTFLFLCANVLRSNDG